MTNNTLSSKVWLRSDQSACYPSLEAAKRGFKENPPAEGESVVWQYDVSAEQLPKLRGLLTDEQGIIQRSTPQRLLDGLASLGSAVTGIACAACLVPATGSVVGLVLLAGPIMQMAGKCFGNATESMIRAVKGQSTKGTTFEQSRGGQLLIEEASPNQYACLTRQGEEWIVSSQKKW